MIPSPPARPTPFTAVVFDFFGTLTPSTPAHVWDEHASRSAAPLGIPATEWRAQLDASFRERAAGALGSLERTFAELARRAGYAPGPAELSAACAARRTAQATLYSVLRPDAAPTLAALRARGLPVGVLSDCSVELADAWPGLPVAALVDARVLSCEEGRCKPDPAVFELIAARLGAAPQDCLYIGDGGSGELTGAAAVGMTAVQLRAPDWAENDAHHREDDWSGPWLGSLAETAAWLG